MQSPPFPRYLVPPRSKYSPQHHILEHPQLPFLPPFLYNITLSNIWSEHNYFESCLNTCPVNISPTPNVPFGIYLLSHSEIFTISFLSCSYHMFVYLCLICWSCVSVVFFWLGTGGLTLPLSFQILFNRYREREIRTVCSVGPFVCGRPDKILVKFGRNSRKDGVRSLQQRV